MPLYAKTNSMGEYVFDWSWADAYSRHGLDYSPKLLTAIPFTPCAGPRVGVAWRPLGTESFIVRAAYGLFYSPPIGNDFRSRGFQDPFAFLVTRWNRGCLPVALQPQKNTSLLAAAS